MTCSALFTGLSSSFCVELAMTCSALFTGLSSSDKYMQLDGQKSHRSHKDGKSRKKGKKKRRKGKESESEEDVEQLHAVSTVLDAPDVRGSCALCCVHVCALACTSLESMDRQFQRDVTSVVSLHELRLSHLFRKCWLHRREHFLTTFALCCG